MKIIGLCGRSGSGKGYVCEMLAGRGIPSIDTDAVYRELTCPGERPTDLTLALAEEFGESVVAADNSLDRRALAAIVFSDPAKLASLNALTHKHILDETRRRLAVLADRGCRAAIVDAPVLFESGFDSECDLTVCVTASEKKRVARIMRRDNIPEEAAEKRLASQKSDGDLIRRCSFVITNDGDDDALEKDLDRLTAILHVKE